MEREDARAARQRAGRRRQGFSAGRALGDGVVRYFPAYVPGNLYAAQLAAAVEAAVPDFGADLARGDHARLAAWEKAHVRGKGSRLAPPELVRAATGEDLDETAFLASLRRKFSA